MTRTALPLLLAALLAAAPLPAMAEYLSPDWEGFSIEGVAAPDWIAGVRDGDYIGMCTACEGTMMLQVQVRPDDGTGRRVRSGETTLQTYDALGRANAEQIGNGAQYLGTRELSFGPGIGFQTRAISATGDFSSTHQLWSDGQQLIVKVYGKNKKAVEALGEKAFAAAAPLTFR